MKILAIETSLDACSVALSLDGEVQEKYQEAPRRHIELLMPMIRELLGGAGLGLGELDGIAYGAGPGSFTGVRIAVSAAQGLGFGSGLPLAGVSSLAALGAEAIAAGARRVFVAQDARMGELYVAAYEDSGGPVPLTVVPDALVRPEEVGLEDDWWLAGGGWQKYFSTTGLRSRATIDTRLRFPRAAMVAQLAAACFAAGDVVTPEAAEPVYLRSKVAQPPS